SILAAPWPASAVFLVVAPTRSPPFPIIDSNSTLAHSSGKEGTSLPIAGAVSNSRLATSLQLSLAGSWISSRPASRSSTVRLPDDRLRGGQLVEDLVHQLTGLELHGRPIAAR